MNLILCVKEGKTLTRQKRAEKNPKQQLKLTAKYLPLNREAKVQMTEHIQNILQTNTHAHNTTEATIT